MRTQAKLSKLQKSILGKLAESETGFVRVSSLYDPAAPNLKAARAATSRALSRLQDRGLVERVSIGGVGVRNIPGVHLIEKS